MASSVSQYPQGFQPSYFPTPATASTTEDPLLTALREYITTGSHASHVTTSELHAIYQNETSQPGGKANLEAFLSTKDHVECASWPESCRMSGTVDLTKKDFSFNLAVMEESAGKSVHGSADGLFIPFDAPITGTLLTLLDNNTSDLSGSCEFKVQLQHGTVHINFSREGKLLATFEVESPAFPIPPRGISGKAEWVE